MEGAPKQYTKEELTELEKSRTLSDADFLNNGANYDVNIESGEKQLILNDEQIEKEKGSMEKILKNERIDRYFTFLKSNAEILKQNGDTEALSLSMSRISSDYGLVEDAVFDNGVWKVTFKDGKVEEIAHAHRKSELFKSLEEKIPKTAKAIENLLQLKQTCGCLYCVEYNERKKLNWEWNEEGSDTGLYFSCKFLVPGSDDEPKDLVELVEIKKSTDENLLKSRRWGWFFNSVKDEIGMTPTDFIKEALDSSEYTKKFDCNFGPEDLKRVLLLKFAGVSKEEVSKYGLFGPFM